MWRSALGVGTSLLGVASAAAAHPGHGVVAQGWLHWATEPLHVAPPALVALGAVLLWRARRRARVRIR
jgi:cytochrome c-type biogenesis protein CcmH/NrfF